jgi:hypothetical protein
MCQEATSLAWFEIKEAANWVGLAVGIHEQCGRICTDLVRIALTSSCDFNDRFSRPPRQGIILPSEPHVGSQLFVGFAHRFGHVLIESGLLKNGSYEWHLPLPPERDSVSDGQNYSAWASESRCSKLSNRDTTGR